MGGFYFVGNCVYVSFWKDIVLVHGSECVSAIIDAVWSFTQHHCNILQPFAKTFAKTFAVRPGHPD